MPEAKFRLVGAERGEEWRAKGHRLRHFFAHRLFHLPKCAPDGYRVAEAMFGSRELGDHWQLLLYATPELVARFPRELFFDRDLIWHEQHFGRPGQVATASVVLRGEVLHSTVHHADLVQRIGRVRVHKTQIEARLRGWPWMLLNGVLAFALERGVRTVRIPGSELAMRHTDIARTVQPYLFERVYDRPASEFPGASCRDGWWDIDVPAAAPAVVMPTPGSEPIAEAKTVCVFHDTERGLGHRREDPALARRADASAADTLGALLEAESRVGARVTYNVVGQLMGDVRSPIESAGHAVGFHSYDHSAEGDQLQRCREVDYRLKGYRPPRSVLDRHTTDDRLAYHNFEWLASSASSLGTRTPVMRGRLVRLPVTLDDFPLYTGQFTYREWEQRLLEHVELEPYTAVGLHDCYAHLFLPRYAELLRKLGAVASLRTFDEVSAATVMGAAA